MRIAGYTFEKATLIAFFIDFLSPVIYNRYMLTQSTFIANLTLALAGAYCYELDCSRGLCM